MGGERVLGVDACKAGWFGIALVDGHTSAYVAATIEELVTAAEAAGPPVVIAVDMPIGLPDRGRRAADVLARRIVGTLRSSVFVTPVRHALDAPDHSLATRRNQALAGQGISVQAFRLKPKLQQVDQWVRQTRYRVVEIHPEVSFATMAGSPLTARKRTWAGVEHRRLLADAGIPLEGDLGPSGHQAAVDDVLDAAAAAWTARRVAREQAQPLPDPPEVFSDGLPCAIWR